ncbi:MAG TPA: lipocalin-like domain-containing protein [Chloroflexota bacterium]
MSDQDLRRALLGTWRLISCQDNVDGTPVKPFGDYPQGYLVYTPDGHVFVQFAASERPELFGRSALGPALLETTAANTAIGFGGYCGTFEVRDGQVVHHMEFNPSLRFMDGRSEARSVVLDGDRAILGTPRGRQFEWQRVDSAEVNNS